MAEQRLDSSKRLRLSGSLLLCLATLGVCFALLAWQYSSVANGAIQKDYAIGSLPSTVEFQSLEQWGSQRAAVAAIGSIFLLCQFIGLGIVYFRHRRRVLLESSFFVPALSIWIVTVMLTALLGPLKSNSVQLWELAPQDISALHLPRILAAQALPGLGEVLLSLTGTAFFAASCASFGLIFIRLLKRCSWAVVCDNSIALLATAFILGQGAISCALILLSILGALNYLTLSALLLLCLAGGLYSLVQVGQGSFQQLRSSFLAFRSEARSWQIVSGLIAVLLALTVLQAWGRLSWDAGSNYFASAKLMALSNEFRYTSESYLALSGFNAEATQAALIVLFGDRSARLVSWFMALSFIVFCAAIARSLGVGRRGTIVAVAMVCSTTAFLDLIGDGKTDLYGAAMAIGAVYWLLHLRPPNRHLALALAGLLSGFALLYRPTYLFPLLVIVAVVVIQNRLATSEGAPLRTRLRPMLRDCLAIGGFAAIPVAFYLVRNVLLVGTLFVPVYSPEATTGQLQVTLQNWNSTGPDMTSIRLFYPFFVTFVTTGASLGTLTPLLIAFAPVLLVYNSVERTASGRLKWLGVTAGIVLALWLLLLPFVQEIRYVLALWGVIFVFAAYLVGGGLQRRGPPLDRILGATIAVVLLALMGRSVYGVGVTTDKPVTGDSALCSGIVQCDMVAAINREAAPGARVLVLAPYTAYLRSDLLSCASTADEMQTLRQASQRGAGAFWTAVHVLGYDYVAYNPEYAFQFQRLDAALAFYMLPDWLRLNRLYSDNLLHTAYRLEGTGLPVEVSRRFCRQQADGRWKLFDK